MKVCADCWNGVDHSHEPKAREWAPNRQPWIVLECGCIDLDWGTFEFIGGKRHASGPLKGKRIRTIPCPEHGTVAVSHLATIGDILRWIENESGRQGTLFG